MNSMHPHLTKPAGSGEAVSNSNANLKWIAFHPRSKQPANPGPQSEGVGLCSWSESQFVSSFHRFTVPKSGEFHEIGPDFMKFTETMKQ
jgi:hypothetical protein